jgi:hypothetical protein
MRVPSPAASTTARQVLSAIWLNHLGLVGLRPTIGFGLCDLVISERAALEKPGWGSKATVRHAKSTGIC